jgi:hypothetical protein
MGRKRSRQFLLDTTAVVHQLHGHTLQQAAVREAVAGGEVLVPVFVRMEYLRGVILNLIEMWCLIRESVTVEDAFIDWSQKMRQERKLKVILMTVPRWLGGQEEWRSKDATLRQLGDLVLRMLRELEAFPMPPDDPLACVLGRLGIPRESYDDDLLSTSTSASRRSRKECLTVGCASSAMPRGSASGGGKSIMQALRRASDLRPTRGSSASPSRWSRP